MVFDVRFDFDEVEGIVDQRKLTVHCHVECIVVPLLLDVLNSEISDPSRLEFPRCVQKVDVLREKKNLLAG